MFGVEEWFSASGEEMVFWDDKTSTKLEYKLK